jgi:hypothetical protein
VRFLPAHGFGLGRRLQNVGRVFHGLFNHG